MKTICLNIDTQDDFMRDYGNLYIPNAEKIESNLEKLTKLARKKKLQIINTGDFHTLEDEEISETPDYINTFPAHCVIGTSGIEFVDATKPINPHVIDWRNPNIDLEQALKSPEIIIYKNKFDMFAGNPYAEKLIDKINPDRAIVWGVASNVCVDYAIQGLLRKGVKVYVPVNAVEGLPNLPSPFKKWQGQGVQLTTKQGIYELLGIRETCLEI
ncbi:MAG TPA: cysteine hydrolase family protein [Candidatus Pacearchaeota archaeon]|nr:cysteine hydrolase family protein [Candidatus Pacearchaeota archaeon]